MDIETLAESREYIAIWTEFDNDWIAISQITQDPERPNQVRIEFYGIDQGAIIMSVSQLEALGESISAYLKVYEAQREATNE